MHSDAATSVCSDSLDPHPKSDQDHKTDLRSYSPQDAKWDTHRKQVEQVTEIFKSGLPHHQRKADRLKECSTNLEFGWYTNHETGETKFKLKSARFCRVRTCPICQWRRSYMWVARFYHAFPKIYADYPEMRYVMLTLTVRNCKVRDLRETVTMMSKAWERMTKRKAWPALGFVRSLEITRGKDGSAHPHFHCLLAVKPGYFKGANYMSTAKWAALWQSALKADYTPVCDVRNVKPRDLSSSYGKTIDKDDPVKEKRELEITATRAAVNQEYWDHKGASEPLRATKMEILLSAIAEVIKYSVKPSDMTADPDWLLVLSDQLQNSRAVSLGGIFREYFSMEDPINLVSENEENKGNPGGIHFGWRETPAIARYRKRAGPAT